MSPYPDSRAIDKGPFLEQGLGRCGLVGCRECVGVEPIESAPVLQQEQHLLPVVGPDHPHLGVLTDMTQAIPILRAAFTPEDLDGEAMTQEIVSLIESLADTSPPSTASAPRT